MNPYKSLICVARSTVRFPHSLPRLDNRGRRKVSDALDQISVGEAQIKLCFIQKTFLLTFSFHQKNNDICVSVY
jgi:hypothetical protein